MLYLLDTNTVIDLLNGNKNIMKRIAELTQDNEIKIPDIVYYEVLRGFKYKDERRQLSAFQSFCDAYGIKYMSFNTLVIAANQWANLKKNGTPLSDDGDVLIGSLAVEHNAILVTNNTKHLGKIEGIKLENWKLQNS